LPCPAIVNEPEPEPEAGTGTASPSGGRQQLPKQGAEDGQDDYEGDAAAGWAWTGWVGCGADHARASAPRGDR